MQVYCNFGQSVVFVLVLPVQYPALVTSIQIFLDQAFAHAVSAIRALYMFVIWVERESVQVLPVRQGTNKTSLREIEASKALFNDGHALYTFDCPFYHAVTTIASIELLFFKQIASEAVNAQLKETPYL